MMFKKKIFAKDLLVLLCVQMLGNCLQMPVRAEAASNRMIQKAYANALSDGTIKYKETNWDGSPADLKYAFYDFNWDGVKDLLLISSCYLYGWTYKKGEVKQLVKKHDLDLLDTIYCDKKSKQYYEPGEGAGCWVHVSKLKNRKLLNVVSYYMDWDRNGKKYAFKKVGTKESKISISKFMNIWNGVYNKAYPNFQEITKAGLINAWK